MTKRPEFLVGAQELQNIVKALDSLGGSLALIHDGMSPDRPLYSKRVKSAVRAIKTLIGLADELHRENMRGQRTLLNETFRDRSGSSA